MPTTGDVTINTIKHIAIEVKDNDSNIKEYRSIGADGINVDIYRDASGEIITDNMLPVDPEPTKESAAEVLKNHEEVLKEVDTTLRNHEEILQEVDATLRNHEEILQGFGTASTKDYTDSVTEDSEDLITSSAVYNYVDTMITQALSALY